nr:hypothetical protein BaRGS_006539 [Batillaria attramentaria]
MSPEEYGPQVFANYPVNQMVGGESHSLWLADTDSREEFDGLRRLGHLHTDVILICFSVVAPSSLEDVRQKWVPEVLRHAREDTPFMLVGTETDLRDDAETAENLAKNQQRPVTADEGKELAQELGAVAYMECSAKTLINLD